MAAKPEAMAAPSESAGVRVALTAGLAAMTHLQIHQSRGEIATGLLFVDPDAHDLHDNLGTVQKPLNQLRDEELIPGSAALAGINDSLR